MTKNIFITAVGGDIACATLRCIHSGYNYDLIIGCDISSYVQGRTYLDKFIQAPPYSDEVSYILFIKKVCIKYNITHLLPMSEPEIIIINKYRDWFNENGILLMINTSFILDIAMSKYNTASYLMQIGIPTPKTYRFDEYAGQLCYPLVVKANHGRGSKDVTIVNNDAEYKVVISRIIDPIIQEYIGTPEEEYTMCIFSNGLETFSLTFKRKLGFGGMSIMVEVANDNRLTEMANIIAQNMNLVGSINVQMRKDADKYYIFEINPRISSTVGFRHLFGFKDVIWWLQYLDGYKDKINFTLSENKVGIKTLGEMLLPSCVDDDNIF